MIGGAVGAKVLVLLHFGPPGVIAALGATLWGVGGALAAKAASAAASAAAMKATLLAALTAKATLAGVGAIVSGVVSLCIHCSPW